MLGLIYWSLAAVGSECVFGDLKREDNRMGTYDGGLQGKSCERTTETAGHHGQHCLVSPAPRLFNWGGVVALDFAKP